MTARAALAAALALTACALQDPARAVGTDPVVTTPDDPAGSSKMNLVGEPRDTTYAAAASWAPVVFDTGGGAASVHGALQLEVGGHVSLRASVTGFWFGYPGETIGSGAMALVGGGLSF